MGEGAERAQASPDAGCDMIPGLHNRKGAAACRINLPRSKQSVLHVCIIKVHFHAGAHVDSARWKIASAQRPTSWHERCGRKAGLLTRVFVRVLMIIYLHGFDSK